MRVALFYHSLVSDWNHGNAHFLRGVAAELQARGHEVRVYEPEDGWSLRNLLAEQGVRAVEEFRRAYPALSSVLYDPARIDLGEVLARADLVVVHEWSTHDLVRRIGLHHAAHPHYALLFHDTHHRAVTDRAAMSSYDLRHYDGVLAFGAVLRDLYLAERWARRAWIWHEAADTRVFGPRPGTPKQHDVVWIGNWGDEERTRELGEFLLGPVRSLGLTAMAYGVRYPDEGRAALAAAHVRYGGWIPNHAVPLAYAGARATLHVPRRPYVERLPGIPTIRVFEALACGIPLVCAPWYDTEHLFRPGRDYLVAEDGRAVREHLSRLIHDPDFAAELGEHGRATIQRRHTCAHRVDELLDVFAELGRDGRRRAPLHPESQP